jgi:proteasome lid subunit RPN8/RPN11
LSMPVITGSSEIAIPERAPPPPERMKAHKWLTERSQAAFKACEGKGFELYLSKVAEEKIRNHALAHVTEKKEVMGLLLGAVYKDQGREYTVVRDVATTDLDATSVSVKFDHQGFEKLFRSLDESGFTYLIVGWYHSHPSYHCFMSATDIQTQRSMFGNRYHSAIVVDPIHKEIEAFYLDNGKVESRPFAVHWDEFQNPYYGTTVRMRRTESGDRDREHAGEA